MAPTAPKVPAMSQPVSALNCAASAATSPCAAPPLRDRELHRALALNAMAAMMRSRVMGRSRTRTPSASKTALPMAAAVGPCAASPAPSDLSSAG